MLRAFAILCLCLIVMAAASAQESCAALLSKAIATAQAACAALLPGQACHAGGAVNYSPAHNADETLTFSEPGDRMPLDAIRELQLMPVDTALSLVLLYPRANIIDGALTMLAVGNVTLQNASDNSGDFIALPVTVRAVEGANVRARPKADAVRAGQLFSGQQTTAVGRTRDSAWILVQEGWVAAELLRPADWALLPVVPPDIDLASVQDTYSPMQRFNLRSGMGDAPCPESPDSGLVVQTPEDSGPRPLVINGIELTFEGTLWLQSTEGEVFASILEGRLLTDDQRYLSGQRVQFSASGQFKASEEYHYARARWLPLDLLPREISLPFSLGGLLSPVSSPEALFEIVTRDSPCAIAWGTDINLRGGPGMEYPIRRGVPANYRARPDAYATGTDGAIWWRLVEGIWIRSGIVVAAGACLDLPTVPLPPLPE